MDRRIRQTSVPRFIAFCVSAPQANQQPPIDRVRFFQLSFPTETSGRLWPRFLAPARLLSSDSEQPCECNINQAFQMLSGPSVTQMLSEKTNRVSRLIASGKPDRDALDELFWTSLARAPSEKEMDALVKDLATASEQRTQREDIFWGLLNSKEFLLRR